MMYIKAKESCSLLHYRSKKLIINFNNIFYFQMKHRAYNYFLLLAALMTFVGANNTGNWQASISTLLNKCLSSSTNINGQKQPPFFDVLRSCLQRRALFTMDVILSTDVIPVLNGLDLVRYKKEKITDSQHEK